MNLSKVENYWERYILGGCCSHKWKISSLLCWSTHHPPMAERGVVGKQWHLLLLASPSNVLPSPRYQCCGITTPPLSQGSLNIGVCWWGGRAIFGNSSLFYCVCHIVFIILLLLENGVGPLTNMIKLETTLALKFKILFFRVSQINHPSGISGEQTHMIL